MFSKNVAFWRVLGTCVSVALLSAVAACGNDDSGDSASAAPDNAAQDGQQGEEPAESVSFELAMGSPGVSGTLIQEAVARVNEKYGHNGKFVEIADSDLVVQGAAQGEFDMGSSSTASVMQVIQEGAPLTFIGEVSRNQWTLIAKDGIDSCEDIDGKRLGLHSAGGVSTALYRAWYVRNCDDEKPKELYIEGSPNRLQALLVDQVDVSMIEVEDVLALPEEGYTMLANFSESLSDIKVGLLYANTSFTEEHPEVVEAVMTELVALQRQVNEDPDSWLPIAKKYLPELEDERIEAAAQKYIEIGLIPTDGGMTKEDVQASIEFYQEAGRLDPGLKAEDIMNRSFLETAVQAAEA